MDLASLEQDLRPLLPVVYLVIIGAVISLIFSLIDLFSVDRVLKLVRGHRAFVFIGREVHFGRLEIPPRSKGGFEVFYMETDIENPLSLVAFLVENYHETKKEEFLRRAESLMRSLKENGLIPRDMRIEDVDINSWAPPSLVSRKVYPSELKDLWMMISFVEYMSEEERRRRWKVLVDLYKRAFIHRVRRRVYNALSYVKDKLASTLTSTTGTLTGILPKDLQKAVQEAQTKAIGGIVGQTYDPLLENSIGRLVTVKVSDVEGEEKRYQGVLGEYSDKYIYVLDVDYRLQMVASVKDDDISVKPIVQFFGRKLSFKPHLSLIRGEKGGVIRNSSDRPIKVEKVVLGGDDKIKIDRVLFPGEEVSVDSLPSDFSIHYEIALESDVVWPRSRATVIGLGDYPPQVLASILSKMRI